jgi:5-methylcytosine-specific restriction protein A
MTRRRRISTRDRVALFVREDGVCHLCGGLVSPGQAWDVSHEIPLALGGADDDSNWKVAHRKCHRDHTSKVDQPSIAKVKRVEARHVGAALPKQRLKSRGFPKREKESRIDKSALFPLPRRICGQLVEGGER